MRPFACLRNGLLYRAYRPFVLGLWADRSGGYKPGMDKRTRDRSGEIFQDDLTENESKPRGPARDDVAADKHLDSQVDSQESDRAMAENRFGVNKPKTDS